MGFHVCVITWSTLCFLYILVSNPALGDTGHHSTTVDEIKGQNISIACKETTDCLNSANNTKCNACGWCFCKEDTPVFVKDKMFCVKEFNFTLNGCEYKEQCQFSVENSDCKKNKCTCLENHDFVEESQTCMARNPKPLVPIIVGCVLGATILITLGAYFITSRGQGGTTHI